MGLVSKWQDSPLPPWEAGLPSAATKGHLAPGLSLFSSSSQPLHLTTHFWLQGGEAPWAQTFLFAKICSWGSPDFLSKTMTQSRTASCSKISLLTPRLDKIICKFLWQCRSQRKAELGVTFGQWSYQVFCNIHPQKYAVLLLVLLLP